LPVALALLESISAKYPKIGYADMFQLASATAVEVCPHEVAAISRVRGSLKCLTAGEHLFCNLFGQSHPGLHSTKHHEAADEPQCSLFRDLFALTEPPSFSIINHKPWARHVPRVRAKRSEMTCNAFCRSWEAPRNKPPLFPAILPIRV
jgi:hypothetical protein